MAKKNTKAVTKKIEDTTPKLNLNIPKLQALLEDAAKKDKVLAKAMKRKDKDFEGCCNYIVQEVLNEVADRVEKKQGFQFVADYQDPDTVLGWAKHYYLEEEVELEDILKKAREMVTPETPKKTEKEKGGKKTSKKEVDEIDFFTIEDGIDDEDDNDEAIMSFELF